jgi:hypothetical protein
MTVVVATFAVLFAVPALLPVAASAFFSYRTGERLAISIGAISGLVLLMSCGLLAYLLQSNISQQLSEDDRYLALSAVFFTGVPALCIFVGNLAGYIAMGFRVP